MPTPSTFFSLRIGTDCSGGPIRYLLRYPGIFVIIGFILIVIGAILAAVIFNFYVLIVGAALMLIGALGNFIVRLRQLSAHKSRRERAREDADEGQRHVGGETQNTTDQMTREQEAAAQEPAPKYNDVVAAPPSPTKATSNPTETHSDTNAANQMPLLSTQDPNPEEGDSPSAVVVDSEEPHPPPPSYETAVNPEGQK
ncbi:uncharacterized protein [Ptychodera flava]|uniref:uncharacterized protein n=1 Tax=Ptychodera flava TaxID=63121 RepID=UPI00396A4446